MSRGGPGCLPPTGGFAAARSANPGGRPPGPPGGAVELPLVADRADDGTLTVQIVAQLREALVDGRLATGERLPSTRALAKLLGVSRTVVTGAYAQLFAEGWIEGRHGSGTYVADGAQGGPAVPGVSGPATRRGSGQQAAAGPRQRDEVTGPSGLRGVPGGRSARPAATPHGRFPRSRRCRAAARWGYPGPGPAASQPPPSARAVFAAHGLRVVPCPVDEGGLVVDALPEGLRLVYLTPAHQYPLGGRLSVPRRKALISWARATGALLLEDDYDGEFRYDVAPLPALFGLDPEVVVYLGTTTKILTVALRVGWLVARPDLAARLADTGANLGEWAAGPAQRAVCTLITTGDLERHIRRMRHEYARRRAAMVAALGSGAAGRLSGDEAGMHMILETRQPAGMVAAAALERGVAVSTVERYFAGPVTRNGLVLGYGGARLADVARGCEILAQILASP